MASLLRTLTAAILMLHLATSTVLAASSSGTVAYAASGCDYFIVEASGGDYALLEWYGGSVPSTGDRVVGPFESYGFTDIINPNSGQSTRVWVEDYWLSRSSVVSKYTSKCGRPPVRQSAASSGTSASPAAPAHVIQSNIAGEFTGWEGETIFALDNGQVWQQATYAYRYHYAYRPRVTIVPTPQGHVMQVDGVDAMIFVRRIR